MYAELAHDPVDEPDPLLRRMRQDRWLKNPKRVGSRTIPAPDLAGSRAQALALTPVSRETGERLDRFVDLLLHWQKTTNLIAPSTIPNLWIRHIADSLQLLPLAPHARTWIDLGSGAGFPGLVIACALAEDAGIVHLVESNGKKAAFLREAARITRVRAVVHYERIEDFVRRGDVMPDVVTARALAPLDLMMGYLEPLLKKGAQALLPRGQDVELELTRASKCWNMETVLVPSKTSAGSRILVLRALRRKCSAH